MTVRDLIYELRKIDDDELEVVLEDSAGNDYEVLGVEQVEEEVVINVYRKY